MSVYIHIDPVHIFYYWNCLYLQSALVYIWQSNYFSYVHGYCQLVW